MSALADIRKCLRTIRLDASDSFVFARAAEGGEWALPGSFLFAECDQNAIDAMSPKERAAFRSGFLGVRSFGWSTLAVVTEIRPDEVAELARELAQAFVERLGAPDVATAHAGCGGGYPRVRRALRSPRQHVDRVAPLAGGGRPARNASARSRRNPGRLAETGKGAFRAFEFVESKARTSPRSGSIFSN